MPERRALTSPTMVELFPVPGGPGRGGVRTEEERDAWIIG